MNIKKTFYEVFRVQFYIIIKPIESKITYHIHAGCLKKNAMEIQQTVVHHKRG
jgi:hypothetical protein